MVHANVVKDVARISICRSSSRETSCPWRCRPWTPSGPEQFYLARNPSQRRHSTFTNETTIFTMGNIYGFHNLLAIELKKKITFWAIPRLFAFECTSFLRFYFHSIPQTSIVYLHTPTHLHNKNILFQSILILIDICLFSDLCTDNCIVYVCVRACMCVYVYLQNVCL